MLPSADEIDDVTDAKLVIAEMRKVEAEIAAMFARPLVAPGGPARRGHPIECSGPGQLHDQSPATLTACRVLNLSPGILW